MAKEEHRVLLLAVADHLPESAEPRAATLSGAAVELRQRQVVVHESLQEVCARALRVVVSMELVDGEERLCEESRLAR